MILILLSTWFTWVGRGGHTETLRYLATPTIFLANVGLASHNIRNNIPTNIANHNQFIPSEHLKTQEYVQTIDRWTE